MRKFFIGVLSLFTLAPCSASGDGELRIARQGSFAVGGTVARDSLGRTFHGDHAYVFYQQPTDARRLPLVFAHGVGQFSKTWETTPDGRDGLKHIPQKRFQRVSRRPAAPGQRRTEH